MTKAELVAKIAEQHEFTRVFARELVDGIFDDIEAAVKSGGEVSIFGFGKFKLVERKARKGRNPQTGEPVKVAASKSIKFTPARSLKESLNKKRRAKK